MSSLAQRVATAACGVALTALAAGAQTSTRQVSLQFKPMVGVEPFACGRSYSGIGTTGVTITPSDYAFYVHDVVLVDPSGKDVPITLEQDGVFQNGTVALLDFEDGSGRARMATRRFTPRCEEPCRPGSTPA